MQKAKFPNSNPKDPKTSRGGIVKPCVKCRTFFEATNNRQKYCGSQTDRVGCAWRVALDYKKTQGVRYNERRKAGRAEANRYKQALRGIPIKTDEPKFDVDAVLFPKPQKTLIAAPNSFMRTRIGALVNSQRRVPVKWTPWFMEKAQ